ncbi:expressed unknown protein [Seminavis robusta]|uniref:JmjC domain-containing protein n=1 Tax=Seminavis robusta TaxID=568900 RepID=A0A9N8EPZ5_9STRA|nr:expressed unknown protein [Seminavis robusta]|eukprot:Sro1483_g276390.1 n/a (401) ;mRNA; f:9988-11190
MYSAGRPQSIGLAPAVLLAVLATVSWNLLVLTTLSPDDVSPLVLAKWATVQWTPSFLNNAFAKQWQQEAWDHWDQVFRAKLKERNLVGKETLLSIPTVNVQDFGGNYSALLQHLESTEGPRWREKPLLLRHLWTEEQLFHDENRRLSQRGLLRENLTIPYFIDSRNDAALAPNGKARIKDIVANISHHGAPHKIGSQLLVAEYPEIIQEVAPTQLVTTLFGDRFQPDHVRQGAFGIPFLPSITTVPIFVAAVNNHKTTKQAFTTLHCEPVGSVAVQLEGAKQWTLVSPEYSFLLHPFIGPDGRSYFVSGYASPQELEHVPRYQVTTYAGDALWVPTWTWHRVDYTSTSSATSESDAGGQQVAIAASLFHLRPPDFVAHNPLFAFLMVPSLIKEILKINSQ